MNMLEIYCDSSFNSNGPSFIGCIILKDGMELHQSTTRIVPDPIRNLECELAAIDFAISQSALFSDGSPAILYNDSTEAVKEFQARKTPGIVIEFVRDQRTYTAKAGEIKNIKVAREVSRDVSDPAMKSFNGITLDHPYFLLTDETWGLRLKGGEAYSILPCSIPHRIICHEVDRSPDNLFIRVSTYANKL